MSSLTLGGIVFLNLFGAALAGLLAQSRLPAHHLGAESRDVIKLATAVVGTLSGFCLGLPIASAKTEYDKAEDELSSSAARVVLLDRIMSYYGGELEGARTLVRKLVEERLDDAWVEASEEGKGFDVSVIAAGIEPIQDQLRSLSPKRFGICWGLALEVSGHIAEAHWLLAEAKREGLPIPFVVVMIFWLSLLFPTFGLLAPKTGTVVVVFFVCAVSVAAAAFLIVDMSHLYVGLIRVQMNRCRQRSLSRPAVRTLFCGPSRMAASIADGCWVSRRVALSVPWSSHDSNGICEPL